MPKGIKSTPRLDLYRKLNLRKDFHYAKRPDWQRKIIEQYPDLYRTPGRSAHDPDQAGKPLADDYCNLRSGFECGPGWQALLEQLSYVADQLVRKLRDSGIQHDAAITPVVVKQKLGELRWQGHSNLCPPFDTLWLAYIDQIRRESTETCEMSGRTGKIRSLDGFVICLSNREYLKWKRNPQKQRLRY
jgi:hypothetical protein